jgi:O-antigen ligase
LVTICCFGPNFFSFDLGITLSLDRILVVALLAAWCIQWRIGKIRFSPLTAGDWIVLAFVLLLGASMLLHDYHIDGPDRSSIPQHYINGYVIPLALYWLGRQSHVSERAVTGILLAMVVFGVYLAVVGLLETAGLWSLVYPSYIANPDIGLHFGRARGPMVHSVSYGIYLATCLLCVWLWRERLPWRWQIIVVLALVPLMTAAIFFTKTRSVWLGVGTAIFLLLALTLRGRVRVAVLGCMVATALVVGLTKMDALKGLKREGTVSDTRQSTDMRKSFAYTSWKMFQDRPLLGFGFGQYARAKLPYLTDRQVELQLEQIRPYSHHNTYLAVLTETGLVGLSLLIALQACWGWNAWQLIRSESTPPWARRHGLLMLGVLAVAFWQMMAHEITFTPIDQSLVWFLAGVTLAVAPLAKRADSTSRKPAATVEGPPMIALDVWGAHR